MSEATSSGRVRLTAHGLTDVGRQRRHNEDHVCLRPEVDLYVVADGMGGHNAGDVASALTTKSLENFFLATEDAPIPGDPPADELELTPEARRLVAAIRKANNDVFEISTTYQQHQGMGSTVVAAHLPRGKNLLHVAHVGDSRCYRIRGGAIEQLTRDHSLVNEALALKPDLTPDELARLPKNIITRALGMKGDIKVDIQSVEVMGGDLFLLCSDGLSGMVDDEQLAEVLSITDDLKEACELLIAMANDAGGADNITAVLLRCDAEPPREGSAPDLSYESAPSSQADLDPADLDQADLDQADLDQADTGQPDLDQADTDQADTEQEEVSRLASVVPPEVAELLESGAEVDIAEPRTKTPMPTRCRCCDHEVLEGNRFCVECGTLIHW